MSPRRQAKSQEKQALVHSALVLLAAAAASRGHQLHSLRAPALDVSMRDLGSKLIRVASACSLIPRMRQISMLPHVRGDGALCSSRACTRTHTHTHISTWHRSLPDFLRTLSDLAFKEMQLSDALDSMRHRVHGLIPSWRFWASAWSLD